MKQRTCEHGALESDALGIDISKTPHVHAQAVCALRFHKSFNFPVFDETIISLHVSQQQCIYIFQTLFYLCLPNSVLAVGRSCPMGFTARKRERGEEASSSAASAIQKSHLGKWLLEELAWGGLSANQVQKISDLVVQDFESSKVVPPQDLVDYAALGMSGKFPNNIWRDLQRKLGENHYPVLKPLEIPLKVAKDYRKAIVPILWPHEVFAAVYKHYKEEFKVIMTGDVGGCESFWRQVRHTDLFAQHPISSGLRDLRKCASTILFTNPNSCSQPFNSHNSRLTFVTILLSWIHFIITLASPYSHKP